VREVLEEVGVVGGMVVEICVGRVERHCLHCLDAALVLICWSSSEIEQGRRDLNVVWTPVVGGQRVVVNSVIRDRVLGYQRCCTEAEVLYEQ
jgi:hypothetical protein